MIVVRNVFRLKFGMAREMKEQWANWKQLAPAAGAMRSYRVLTDFTGPSYSFILETEFDDLASYESGQKELFDNPAWRTFYSKVTPLVESGYREIYTVVDAGTADTMTRAAAGAIAEPA
jgi:hypothetical protein